MKVSGHLSKIIRASVILSAVCPVLLCLSCKDTGYAVFQGYAQGGTYKVTVNMDGVLSDRKTLATNIENILTTIDTTFSGYNRNSILSRLNSEAEMTGTSTCKSAVTVNKEFSELLAISKEFTVRTNGAFNVAAAPIFDIWGFGFTTDSLPSQAMVDSALSLCHKGKKLNFNAIAQGYTCDLIGRMLDSLQARDYLVDVGEILCKGVNAHGRPWSIGIDTPVDGNNTPGAQLSGIWHSNGSGRAQGVVTSGNYRKFYVKDGKKYAHTIDPRTGYPVQHNLLSATIIAPTATEADAMATACMVLGFEDSVEILKKAGLEACLITSDTTWFSPGFAH